MRVLAVYIDTYLGTKRVSSIRTEGTVFPFNLTSFYEAGQTALPVFVEDTAGFNMPANYRPIFDLVRVAA